MDAQFVEDFKKMMDRGSVKFHKEAKIVWRLMHQEKHINYQDDKDITFLPSIWMRQMDNMYYATKSLDKFFEVVDDKYQFGIGNNGYTKAVKPTMYSIDFEYLALKLLPRGYFVNKKNKAKLVKKLGKNVSVCKLRDDWSSFMDAVESGEKYEEMSSDWKAIMWLSKYVDEEGCLWSGFREVSERRTYHTPNLQQLKKYLRDVVLHQTNYCDLDAVKSNPYDFAMLLDKYGEDSPCSQEEIRILNRFGGIQARENISNLTGLINKELKTATLSFFYGGTQLVKGLMKTSVVAQYNAARRKFIEYLYGQDEFQHLDNFSKPVSQWEYDDYAKVQSRILCRLETQKMAAYGKLLENMGFKVLQWMYDGLIIDKKPSEAELEIINSSFESMMWKSPLKIEKVWN